MLNNSAHSPHKVTILVFGKAEGSDGIDPIKRQTQGIRRTVMNPLHCILVISQSIYQFIIAFITCLKGKILKPFFFLNQSLNFGTDTPINLPCTISRKQKSLQLQLNNNSICEEARACINPLMLKYMCMKEKPA